jgi:hypothetical protein
MTELTATDTISYPWEAQLSVVPNDVVRLAEILDLEFESLKVRDLAAFEAVQEEKNQLLQNLSQLAGWASAQNPVPLLQRQLQAVKGALQALQGESVAPAVDLYDRMGQIARRPGAWGYQLA